MSNQEELESQIILIDEDGNEVEFEIIDVIQFEETHYAILLPKEENDDESALIFRVVEEDGEDILSEIESDEEWERVVAFWESQEEI